MKRWSIYILINPKTFHVFYVGATKWVLRCQQKHSPAIMIIVAHIMCGVMEPCKNKIPIRILKAKAYWTKIFRGVGYDLTNTEVVEDFGLVGELQN